MISRRTWLRIISLFGLLLVLLGGYGYFSWTRLLERQHIRQVDWQGPSLSLGGLHLARLELLQQDADGSLRYARRRLFRRLEQAGSYNKEPVDRPGFQEAPCTRFTAITVRATATRSN